MKLNFKFNFISKIKDWWRKRKLNKAERKHLEELEKLRAYSEIEEKYTSALQEESQKQEYLNKLYDIRRSTYTKKMVTWILAICIIDIQAMFIMAIFDKGAHLDGIVNNLTNTILGVSFIYMIRAYYDSKAEHKNMDDNKIASLKSALSNKLTNILQAAGITNITGEQFLESSLKEDKSSRKFQIDINGVNITASRQSKPKPDLLSLAKLKQLNSKPKVKTTQIIPTPENKGLDDSVVPNTNIPANASPVVQLNNIQME